MPPKPKMGRPRKPATKKQSQSVLVSLTPGERAEVERAAGGEPLATFVRKVTLRAARAKIARGG